MAGMVFEIDTQLQGYKVHHHLLTIIQYTYHISKLCRYSITDNSQSAIHILSALPSPVRHHRTTTYYIYSNLVDVQLCWGF